MEKLAMFSAVNFRPGFKITFENGYTASVQWGPDNYCGQGPVAQHLRPVPFEDSRCHVEAFSVSAEIAASGPDGEFCKVADWFPHDDVRGHCTPAEVLKFLQDVANL